MTVTLNASTSSGLAMTSDNSGAIALQNAGTTGLNIDASGRSTTPLQPAFSASFSTSYTQSSGVQLVPFNAENFDIGSNFNTGTSAFTAPVAGKYLFTAYIGSSGGGPAQTYFGIGFFVNGSSQGLCWNTKDSGYQKDAISQILNLSAGDSVTVRAEVQNSLTIAVGSFCGYLLG
jgi:hypothetical protein